jgi:soluble P-type ATPase
VRERLRDLAAASHAVAVGQVERAAEGVTAERERLEAQVTSAGGVLAQARSIAELEGVTVEIAASRGDVDAAVARHGEAIGASAATEKALKEKARQLRTAERILELVQEQRASKAMRGEQRAADDLAAGRRR